MSAERRDHIDLPHFPTADPPQARLERAEDGSVVLSVKSELGPRTPLALMDNAAQQQLMDWLAKGRR